MGLRVLGLGFATWAFGFPLPEFGGLVPDWLRLDVEFVLWFCSALRVLQALCSFS